MPLIVKAFPDFSLQDDSYLSSWNPDKHHWEIHQPSTLRTVFSGQRLLYKVTRSMDDQLDDTLCAGLIEELEQQLPLGKRKRGLEALECPNIRFSHPPSTIPNTRTHPSTSLSASMDGSHIRALKTWNKGKVLQCNDKQSGKAWNEKKLEKKQRKGSRPRHAKPAAGKAKNNRHEWPTNFHVSEVEAGFHYIEEGKKQGSLLENLYHQFYGKDQKFVHSTFSTRRRWWRTISLDLIDTFVRYGETKCAMWARFTQTVARGYESDWDSSVESGSGNGSGSYPVTNMVSDSESESDLDSDSGSGSKDSADGNADSERTQLDSSMLCMFCEQTLPVILSSTLHSNLAELLLPANSAPVLYSTHPQARKHISPRGMALRMEFCGGHAVQHTVIDAAEGNHWPAASEIEFNKLNARVLLMQEKLIQYAKAPSTNIFYVRLTTEFQEKGQDGLKV